MIVLDLDWSSDAEEPYDEILAFAKKHEAQVLTYVLSGPGGGNPNISLRFKDRNTAYNAFVEYNQGVPEEDWTLDFDSTIEK